MQSQILTHLKKFRDCLFELFSSRPDATMDLIDALSTNTGADTVVKLSLNPAHRRTYNSITDVVSNYHRGDEDEQTGIEQLLVEQSILENTCRPYYLLGIDCTPYPRPFSPTLGDRSIVYAPNPINTNKPITIGHKYSVIAYLPPKEYPTPPWILPLNSQRVNSNKDEVELGCEQLLKAVSQIHAVQEEKLCVNVVDSRYSTRLFIKQTAASPHLVNIIRVRSNRVFWQPVPEDDRLFKSKIGHEQWYGDVFRLKDATTWHIPDEATEMVMTTRQGKPLNVQIQAWRNMLMRQKDGLKMNEHPFTLVQIKVNTGTAKTCFKNPMWLIVTGDRRADLSLSHIFLSYRQRYDLEHFFRFGKNRLLMDKFQTCDDSHEENWFRLTTLAYAQLFIGRHALNNMPYPWEEYLPKIKDSDIVVSPSQAQRGFNQLTSMIGTPAKPPKPRGRPLGRQKGQIQPRREHSPLVIKSKKHADPPEIKVAA